MLEGVLRQVKDTTGADGVAQGNPLFGEPVKVRRSHERIALKAHLVLSNCIHEDDDEVVLFSGEHIFSKIRTSLCSRDYF